MDFANTKEEALEKIEIYKERKKQFDAEFPLSSDEAHSQTTNFVYKKRIDDLG